METLTIVRKNRKRAMTTGSLEDLSFAELAQIMALGGKTGCVRVMDGDFRGEAWFVSGRLRHARIFDMVGEEAFVSLVRWTSGTFRIAHGIAPSRPTMDHDAMHLLMLSLKDMDEAALDVGSAKAI
jgi:hypothetical protein